MSAITCPVCGVQNRESARICRSCGEPFGVPQAWPALLGAEDDDEDSAPICDDQPGRPMAQIGHVTEDVLREMVAALGAFDLEAQSDILELLAEVPDDGRPINTPPILPMDAD